MQVQWVWVPVVLQLLLTQPNPVRAPMALSLHHSLIFTSFHPLHAFFSAPDLCEVEDS